MWIVRRRYRRFSLYRRSVAPRDGQLLTMESGAGEFCDQVSRIARNDRYALVWRVGGGGWGRLLEWRPRHASYRRIDGR